MRIALLTRLDRFQEDHAWLAIPVGVAKKFGEDRAGSLAALIAYFSFFSLFPLLMVLSTISGIVLKGSPSLRDRVLDSALAQFPVIGPRVGSVVRPQVGSGWLILVGSIFAIWSGLGGVSAAQEALDDVWDVPRRERPSFVRSRLRALMMLGVLGLFVGLVSVGGAVSAALGQGWVPRIGAFALAGALNVGTVMVAYRMLTTARPTWAELWVGALVAGVAWTVLQTVGGQLVDSRIRGASEVYGFFAIVIGLLTWIYLTAQVFLVGAEINVVLARRLWPRRLFPPPLDEADQRAIVAEARESNLHHGTEVDVRFQPRPEQTPGDRSG